MPSSASTDGAPPQAQGQPSSYPTLPTNAHPAWPLDIPLAMHVHLSTSPTGDVFSHQWTSGWREDADAELPHFLWDNITFGDWKDSREVEYEVKIPEVGDVFIVLWFCYLIFCMCRVYKITVHYGPISSSLEMARVLILRAQSLIRSLFIMSENVSPLIPSRENVSHLNHVGLTKYMPKAKIRKEKNLLKGSKGSESEVEEEQVGACMPSGRT